MEPIVDLAPGAEENALGLELAESIRKNLADPAKRRSFAALRGAVLIVAQDLGDSLTLRFDHGRLTIHDGTVGIPTITFCADLETLRRLRDVSASRFFRLLSIGSARSLIAQITRGDLQIYGLSAHPRMVVRFLRLIGK